MTPRPGAGRPDPAALDLQAAVLRKQAAGRHRRQADRLEHQARLLEHGADELRAADRAFTSQERAEHLGRARLALDEAEAEAFTRAAPVGPEADRELMSGVGDTRPADPSSDTRPDLTDPIDPLDQARADLAGDPDPYGEVPDAGDFGLPPAGVPTTGAWASFSDDTYRDQPDVGSTSSHGGAGLLAPFLPPKPRAGSGFRGQERVGEPRRCEA